MATVFNVQSEMKRAVQLHQQGQLKQAGAIYRRVLREEPGTPDAMHLLGLVHHQQGDNEKAARFIGRAVGLVPDSAVFHNSFGECLRKLGKTNHAIHHFREAIGLDDGYVAPLVNLARLETVTGDVGDAIHCIERALAIQGDSPRLREILNGLKQQSSPARDDRDVEIVFDSEQIAGLFGADAMSGCTPWFDPGVTEADEFVDIITASSETAQGAVRQIDAGETAGVRFWRSRSGQRLIRSFDDGLVNWLSSTCPNLFGSLSDIDQVIARFGELAVRNRKHAPHGAATKLEALIMATAFSVYATTDSLGDEEADVAGFVVTDDGLGAASFDLGSEAGVFAAAADTLMTVREMLACTDRRARDGKAYVTGARDDVNIALRTMAERVYSRLLAAGNI